MHGRKSLRVTDEIPLNDVSKDRDKDICPKVKLSVPHNEEKFAENQQDQINSTTDEKREDVADCSIGESELTDESVKILEGEKMGLIGSKKYEDVVPATQDQEEYHMIIEEDPDKKNHKLIIEESHNNSKDVDPETRKQLFDLYGGTSLAKSPETKEQCSSENGTSENNNSLVNSKKTRIFDELRGVSSEEPTPKRRRISRIPKTSLAKLPLPGKL